MARKNKRHYSFFILRLWIIKTSGGRRSLSWTYLIAEPRQKQPFNTHKEDQRQTFVFETIFRCSIAFVWLSLWCFFFFFCQEACVVHSQIFIHELCNQHQLFLLFTFDLMWHKNSLSVIWSRLNCLLIFSCRQWFLLWSLHWHHRTNTIFYWMEKNISLFEQLIQSRFGNGVFIFIVFFLKLFLAWL